MLDESIHTQKIHNSSTRSHASEEKNRTRNRCKNCKCKRAVSYRFPSVVTVVTLTGFVAVFEIRESL